MSSALDSDMDISATLDELLRSDGALTDFRDLPLSNGGIDHGMELPCSLDELDSFDLNFLFAAENEGAWPTGACDFGVANNPWGVEEVVELVQGSSSFALTSQPDFMNQTEIVQPESQVMIGNESGTLEAIQCAVEHDHSYAASVVVEQVEQVALEQQVMGGDSPVGSNSDTGYETMSSPSKSPGSQTGHIEVSPQSAPTSAPSPKLSSLALLPDPVKLIDERIKYFMSSQQVTLTEEEKAILIEEGLPIPTTLPLTKVEEKALKTVRRKIRNKVAAQESRRKKKDYINGLEERVSKCTTENKNLQRKVEILETENKTLLQQLKQLQAAVARNNPIVGRPMKLGSCLMVVVLCFAVLFGNILPYKVTLSSAGDHSTVHSVRSRALLSLDTPHSQHGLMDWLDFYKSLLVGDHAPPTTPSIAHPHRDMYMDTAPVTNDSTQPSPPLVAAHA